LFWDKGQEAYERILASNGSALKDLMAISQWFDALRVVWYGIRGILWQRLMVGRSGAHGSLIINAAMVYQSSTAIGNPVEVVNL